MITMKEIQEQINRWIEDDSELIKDEHKAFDIAIDQEEFEIASSCVGRIGDYKYSHQRLARILEWLVQLENLEGK